MTNTMIVGIASHKGGTGRTTLSLGLAWALGQSGRRVGLVDAAPTPTHDLIACDAEGVCSWPGVERLESLDADAIEASGLELILVDLPPMLARSAASRLRRCDAVLLTFLPDPLALRTLAAATAACESAVAEREDFAVLGLAVSLFNPEAGRHRAVIEELNKVDPDLIIEPPLPIDPALGRWAMSPGSEPAPGPGRDALLAFAEAFRARVPTADAGAGQPEPAIRENETSPTRDRAETRRNLERLVDEGVGDVASFGGFAADDDLEDEPREVQNTAPDSREDRDAELRTEGPAATPPARTAPLRLDEPLLRRPAAEGRAPTPRRSRAEVETRDEPRPDFAQSQPEGMPSVAEARVGRSFEEETVTLRASELEATAPADELQMHCHYCEQEIAPDELARDRAKVIGDGRLACRGCAVHVRTGTNDVIEPEPEPEPFPAPDSAVDAPRRSSTTRVLIRRLLSFLGDSS